MTRPLQIMVIEDYDALREAICDVLSKDGHEVVGVAMAEDVDDEPTGTVIDLYIVDINLPGENGISLAARIRQSQPDVGIVIVSARTSLGDRIGGYESGANIYLTKPLSLDELRAVVAGFGRRMAASDLPTVGSVTVCPSRMLATGPSGEVRLNQQELVLLSALSRAAQQSLQHWQVAVHLGKGDEISKETLEVKVGRLRKKLVACGIELPAIQAMRGVGYKLCCSVKIRQ